MRLAEALRQRFDREQTRCVTEFIGDIIGYRDPEEDRRNNWGQPPIIFLRAV